MRHVQLVVHRLWVDDEEVPLRLATLVVVERDGSDRFDWEVVAESTTPITLDLRRARLRIAAITGADADAVLAVADLEGDAVVVRYVETALVLRGDGELGGFDPALLAE